MDQPLTPLPTILPLAQASAIQLAQAILSVRDSLAVYYPTVTLEQWQQALERLDCPLYVTTNGITATALGLRGLINHFEMHSSSSGMALDSNEVPTSSRRELLLPSEWGTVRKTKKTYDMHPSVLEGLARTSFWRRVSKSYLVNRALVQLLADMPDSQVPIPSGEF